MSGNLNNFKLSKNFNLVEFQCPCCKTVRLEPHLVSCLQALRSAIDEPLHISSGYRCPAHNKAVKGVPHSRHILGQAADILLGESEPEFFLNTARKLGFAYCYYNHEKLYYHVQIDIA
jgi:hypothetical protein